MILPLKYQAQVHQMLHDGQGHQGIDRTIALCRQQFYCNTMYRDVVQYVKDCPWCQVAKGPCVGPKTQPGSIVANGPLDLLCVDFTTMAPSRESKENVLVLTDAFSKFSQAFVTPNQKALTVAKIIVDKWFYIYGIPARIHSDKGQSFDSSILEHLYTMYGVKQSTTTPYNLHGNSTYERFNCMLHNLLKTLDKEQKANWPLHSSSLVFAYNVMPHSGTGYQPYEFMFGHKAPLSVTCGLIWHNIMTSIHRVWAHGWKNNMNSSLLQIGRHWKTSSKLPKTALHVGGSPPNIPKDNLVLLRDHPEGRHKIQDIYKSELFMVVLRLKDPNVYIIHPLCGGLVHMVNWWQLFDLKKSSLGDCGDLDPDPTNSLSPKTYIPFYQPQKIKTEKDMLHDHLYGTRSKTQTKAIFQTPDLNEENGEEANG